MTEQHGRGPLPENVGLALEAFERAQAETAAGNHEAARRWLDRACRLAPHDQTLSLALATACLGSDDTRAAALFATISAANDVREAWFGLATARRRLGDVPGAASALASALARHAPDGTLAALSDAIAREAGAPGWCGLSGDGEPTIRPLNDGEGCELRLDGGRISTTAGRLPARWRDARTLTVTTSHGAHLLGSPIDTAAITASIGCVSCRDGGLAGWAWHPGDPDTDPIISIRPASGCRSISITASDIAVRIDDSGLLARPRGFTVAAEALRGLTGLLHVRGRDGRDLLGSPLDPRADQRTGAAAATALARLYPTDPARRRAQPLAAPPAMPVVMAVPQVAGSGSRRHLPVDVVVPVHDGTERTLACLDSVLATVRRPSRVIVVDDASRQETLVRALELVGGAAADSAEPPQTQSGFCGERQRRHAGRCRS